MQIKIFDIDNLGNNEVVIFPAKIAYPHSDNEKTRYSYTNRLNVAGCAVKILSASFDKATNRARLYIEASRTMSLSVDTTNNEQFVPVTPGTYTPIRSSLEVKLDVPRGSFTESRAADVEVVSYTRMEVKLRLANREEVILRAPSRCDAIQTELRHFLDNYYRENGCPAEVDRRLLPEAIKGYTGELRKEWRVEQHDFGYPAGGLANAIIDHLNGLRLPRITIDKLLDWHLIPQYPRTTIKCTSSIPATCTRQAFFAGIFQKGGQSNTKNLQLSVKLSKLLDTRVTVKDIEDGIESIYSTSTRTMSSENRPFISNMSDASSIVFLGVTKRTGGANEGT
jgi:hypothetical protein